MLPLFIYAHLAPCILCLSACSYLGTFSPPVKQDVEVILKENDFKIAQTNLVGEAAVFELFGFIPVGDERLFSRALADLYRSAEGKMSNTSSQLVNWTYDDTSTFFIIGSRKKIVFRADLMQFEK